MATWFNKEDGKEYSEREIKAIHKNISFKSPSQLSIYEVVLPTPKPECSELQQAIYDGVETDSKGNLVRKWKVVDMFQAYTNDEGVLVTKLEQEQAYQAKKVEDASKAVRTERDRLLQETDWYSCSDVVMPENIKVYRQALRDITLQQGFPFDVVYPTIGE